MPRAGGAPRWLREDLAETSAASQHGQRAHPEGERPGGAEQSFEDEVVGRLRQALKGISGVDHHGRGEQSPRPGLEHERDRERVERPTERAVLPAIERGLVQQQHPAPHAREQNPAIEPTPRPWHCSCSARRFSDQWPTLRPNFSAYLRLTGRVRVRRIGSGETVLFLGFGHPNPNRSFARPPPLDGASVHRCCLGASVPTRATRQGPKFRSRVCGRRTRAGGQ